MNELLKVPMITGAVQKIQPEESLTDAFDSATTAIAKVLSSFQTSNVATESQRCPSLLERSLYDLRMKNLVTGVATSVAQTLRRYGILRQDFDSEKKFVVLSLNNLA